VTDPQRILVFGGTFDPPHLAHSVLPPMVAKTLHCDRILYVPAALNPLKADAPPTDEQHRLAMLKLAIADVPNAAIDTLELDRPGPSYMVDTLATLRQRFGSDAEMRLLIGADQAVQFHRWRDWQRIIKLAVPAVMLRPPLREEAFVAALAENFSPEQVQQWRQWTIPLPMYDISSTEIRRRLRDGGEMSDILSPAVADYIREHRLYFNGNG
jgi:nicotinate-nucleotide adenylyltransferase